MHKNINRQVKKTMSSPLKGGDKLRRYLDRLAQNGRKASHVKVGIPENATYDDGTSVVEVAMVQEFGSPAHNIPARPFMRRTISERSGQWTKGLALLMARGLSPEDALDRIGGEISNEVKDTIDAIHAPPLAEETVKARERVGSQNPQKPLQDTLRMTNSITHQVESDDGS